MISRNPLNPSALLNVIFKNSWFFKEHLKIQKVWIKSLPPGWWVKPPQKREVVWTVDNFSSNNFEIVTSAGSWKTWAFQPMLHDGARVESARLGPCPWNKNQVLHYKGQKSSQGLPQCNWDVNKIKGRPFHLLIRPEDSFFFSNPMVSYF